MISGPRNTSGCVDGTTSHGNAAMNPRHSCISFTFHLPTQNQEGRDRNSSTPRPLSFIASTTSTKPLKKQNSERERGWDGLRERKRERTEYNSLTRNSDRLYTNCDCSCFMFLGGYNIAVMKMQCKEVASRSSRELRADKDTCRVDEFLEMALEELGSSICGSLEEHNSKYVRKRISNYS